MPQTDITNRIERLEAFEKRANVVIKAMAAFLSEPDDDQEQTLTARGELHSIDGDELAVDIQLDLVVYDKDGRVIETSMDFVDSETFFSFHTFELSVYLRDGLFGTAKIIPKVN